MRPRSSMLEPMQNVASTMTPPSPLAPRIPGLPVIGHLMDFRADRTGVQLRTARSHPDAAALRLGVFDVVMVSSPAMAHDILATQADGFTKSLGLSIFLRPVL